VKSIALEHMTNKLIVEDHRWRFTHSRLEYMAQKIRHTISIFRGEWFMDRKIGIPYIPTDDMGKSMHRRMVETALQVRIGELEGVEKFIYFQTTVDKGTRELYVKFAVQIDIGETYSDVVPIGGVAA
jgi:hypothetical protein